MIRLAQAGTPDAVHFFADFARGGAKLGVGAVRAIDEAALVRLTVAAADEGLVAPLEPVAADEERFVQNWTDKSVACAVSFDVPKAATASYLAPEETDRSVHGDIAPEPLFTRDASYSPDSRFTIGPFGCWISKIRLLERQ